MFRKIGGYLMALLYGIAVNGMSWQMVNSGYLRDGVLMWVVCWSYILSALFMSGVAVWFIYDWHKNPNASP